MKAAVLHKLGGISELRSNLIIEDFPLPELNPGEVLVKVGSASLNHRDLWITKGLYSKIKLPVILGSDGSGIVENIGNNVSNVRSGDEVIINPSLDWGTGEDHQSPAYKILGLPDNGTFAEFVKIPSKYVYPKPAHLNFTEAAALPLVGLTAYRACVVKAGIQEGDNVLITGIGGGVAAMALAFCLALKTNVYVTSGSPEKIDKAIELGAKAGVSYKNDTWGDELKQITGGKIDVVIDGAGGDTIAKALDFISYGGRIISYGATNGIVKDFDIRRVFWKQLSIIGSTMGSDKDFQNMLNFVNEKKIIPVIDREFAFKDIHQAFERMNDSAQFGKIIVNMA